jgi:hypothetical protein
MTPTDTALIAEAEKVARNILRDHTSITNALVAFAQRHGEREGLRGQIKVMEVAVGFAELLKKARAQLAALEKSEEVAAEFRKGGPL